jgi:AraC-like DNA-binding protein
MGKKGGIFGQSMIDSSTKKYRIPGFFVPHIVMFVEDAGGDVRALYAAAGIERGVFVPEHDHLTEDQLYRLVCAARAQSNDPAFGFEIGARFSIGSFGLLSRALMSCATLREVVQMLERYSVLVLPLVRFSSYETSRHFVVEVNALSRYPVLNQSIFEAIMACWDNIVFLLLGQQLAVDKISCRFEAPEHHERYTKGVAQKFEFAAQRNLIYLNRSEAALPLATANPIDAISTREQCEKELIRSLQTRSLSDKVSDLLRYYLDASPSSSEIAGRLNMTDRTFRRKLAQEGASYRKLVKSVREEIAIYYLEETKLQVAEIALKLGYQETSNFRAAFKSWKGVSPRQWRQGSR